MDGKCSTCNKWEKLISTEKDQQEQMTRHVQHRCNTDSKLTHPITQKIQFLQPEKRSRHRKLQVKIQVIELAVYFIICCMGLDVLCEFLFPSVVHLYNNLNRQQKTRIVPLTSCLGYCLCCSVAIYSSWRFLTYTQFD